MNSIYDLGVFDQAVWGILHEKPFISTVHFNRPINWLGFHFHPILFLFSVLYYISPSVNWFIIAQALSLSLAAWPIFLIGKQICQSEKAGFLWALCYLVNPFLLNSAAWDFHPMSLAVPFIASALLAIERKNFPMLLLSCLTILLCKEHLGLMVIGFGFIWWIRNKYWKTSLILISIGMVHFFVVFEVIMPALSTTAGHVMLSDGSTHLNRYSWLGNSFQEILYSLSVNPLFVIKTTMLTNGGLRYLLLLLLLFLGFFLLAPEFLVIGIADLAVNLLSTNPMPRSIFAYHSVCLIPIFIIATIYGVKRIPFKKIRQPLIKFAGLIFLVNLICGYFYAPLPLPGSFNYWAPKRFANWQDPEVAAIRSALDEKKSVSVQNNIAAHFSQRDKLYLFPNKLEETDIIILRLESPTTKINNISEKHIGYRKDIVGTFDNHLQMDRTEYISTIDKLLNSKQYGILIWNDPWLVLEKEIRSTNFRRDVDLKLNRLRNEWHV
ncbi:MAG: DUF2079 domain-containing protein, partial [Desulfobacterales bacterium]